MIGLICFVDWCLVLETLLMRSSLEDAVFLILGPLFLMMVFCCEKIVRGFRRMALIILDIYIAFCAYSEIKCFGKLEM